MIFPSKIQILNYSAATFCCKNLQPINLSYKKMDEQKDQELDNDDVPDVITAKKLVEEFDAITNTNEALAQFYLQVIIQKTIFFTINIYYLSFI